LHFSAGTFFVLIKQIFSQVIFPINILFFFLCGLVLQLLTDLSLSQHGHLYGVVCNTSCLAFRSSLFLSVLAANRQALELIQIMQCITLLQEMNGKVFVLLLG
jgi:hypothetical protein